jgi:hypothetical protein
MLKSSGLAAILALAVAACASQSDAGQGPGDDDIIGGVPVTSAKLDAVGSLQLQQPGSDRRIPFCTGTLISPTLVVTAKHCGIIRDAAGQPHPFTELGEIAFAVGNDAAAPRSRTIAERVAVTELNEGGIGLGSDVAVYYLKEPVADVTPLPIAKAPLGADDIGKSFVAIGYGIRDAAGNAGQRLMGNITLTINEGSPRAAIFGSFDAFKADIEKKVGRPLTPEEVVEVQEIFDKPLLAGYESFFKAKEGDVQACNGDSGGPLLRKVDGQLSIFGVASWVPNKSTTDALCSQGVTYATFGPSAKDLLAEAACGGEPLKGRCDGTTVVRCLTDGEGGPRTTKTRCDELDLVCGTIDGKAGCVEPAPAPQP